MGGDDQKARVRGAYLKKVEWMKGNNLWNGEFGPVYAHRQYDPGDATDEINISQIASISC